MKQIIFFCVVFVQVTSFSVHKNDGGLKPRQKRQDDRWIWGYVDTPVTNNYTLSQRIIEKEDVPTTTTEGPTPCDPVDTVIPDFSAPGRRISEVKCYEHIYDIKVREELDKRNEACAKYLREKKGVFGVIGGREALPGEFPHMAAVGWKAAVGTWIFKCGGSLISSKFVLTAAHCTKASDRDTTITDVIPKIVRLGDRNILDDVDQDSQIFPVNANIIRIIEHPEYKPPKKYFDIALFELETEVSFSKFVQPACLYSGTDQQVVGRQASLTGWGVVDIVKKTTSPILQTADVDVLDSQQCDSLLRPSCNRHWCGMQEHQLCAGKLKGGVDACQGDSGGPLQLNITLPENTKGVMYHVIGVTSFGIGCALPELPGIYTKVNSFLDWIENIVWT